jgi:uncharacterized protein (DUF1015 family)
VGTLIGAGGHDHRARQDLPGRGLQPETRVGRRLERGDLDALPHRHGEAGGVSLEARHDLIARHEAVRVLVVVRLAGQLKAPIRRDETEAVPSFPPALGDAVLFEYDGCDSLLLELATNREPGLAGADHHDLELVAHGICDSGRRRSLPCGAAVSASIRRRTVASPAMAEVRPLEALHYDLNAVSSLADVTAPPYDVIDSRQRAELIARSPFNVVQIDLPEAPAGGDPYEHAAETLEAWTLQGVLAADRDPAIWALTQEYTGPDGATRTRHGFLARVRVTEYGPGLVRPHERTQPGPKEDRLRLTEATRHNLSPIFSLYPGDVWRHIEPHLGGEPWGEVADPEGTVHRMWRIADPAVHDAVTGGLADAELLIADGHHRYETARTYADAIGGDGPHRYTLMCLVSLEDPGLTIFGTNRLLSDLDDGAQERLADGIREHFEVSDVTEDEIDPAGSEGIGVFGYVDSRSRGLRLRLADTAVVDEALAGMSEAYRRLDAVILEELILKRTLGMSDDDISAKRGLGYVTGTAEALRQLAEGTYQAAFFLRPTPVEQVRAVAAEGETMPSKSTYFFPKVLTGMVFNPLS